MKRSIVKLAAVALGALCLASTMGCDSDPDSGSDAQNVEDRGPGGDAAQLTPIDRMGRPEVTNFIMRAPDPKVAYNREDAFAVSEAGSAGYRQLFMAGIAFWDGLDGTTDWEKDGALPRFVDTLLADYLVVDLGVACSVDDDTYLAIELPRKASDAAAGTAGTCGGRTPNADIIDTTMSVLIDGPDTDGGRGDGVERAANKASDQFPYLAEPYPTVVPSEGGADGAGGSSAGGSAGTGGGSY